MKNYLFSFSLIALSLASCKRGEDDPSFTLNTRTNRISRMWNVVQYSYLTSDSSAIIEGDSLISFDEDSLRYARPIDWKFTFEKDGTYINQLTFLKSDSINEQLVISKSGQWEFSGGKNSPINSQLVLFETESREYSGVEGSNIRILTTSNPLIAEVYDIRELRNSKMVIYRSTIYADPFTSYTVSIEFVLEPAEN